MAGHPAIAGPTIVLVNSPIAKPSEPPAGLAKLSGALTGHGVPHILLDANMEGLLFLLGGAQPSTRDTWTDRAQRHLSTHLSLLRQWDGYANFSRYRKTVSDITRLLEKGTTDRFRLSLADYTDSRLAPVKSQDLLSSAEHPEENPFHSFFMQRLDSLAQHLSRDPVFGFSLNYLSQALCTFAFVGLVRREIPSARIVLGGGLVTSWMSSPLWTNPFRGLVDHMVAGPGERSLLSMAGVRRTEEGRATPSFDGLPLSDYLAPGPIIPYSASRGCYWRDCSFCPEKSEGTLYLPTPSSTVFADMRALTDRHRPALIHLVDNAVSPSLMRSLATKPPLAAPWYGFSRMTPDLCDEDFCRALYRSGCVMLKIGLESGDQKVLDALCKGVSLEEASKSLNALKRAGITTYVYLLFGTPAENMEAAERTLDFAATRADMIDYLNLAIFNMPVHSPESESVHTRSFYEGDLPLYTDFVHPAGWNRREVRRFLDSRFKRHPSIRPILLRQPPVFTSNHAPLFGMKDLRSKPAK